MSVLNGEPFLTEAVESIFTHSFTDFEFVVAGIHLSSGNHYR
jgi:hypothetical protein